MSETRMDLNSQIAPGLCRPDDEVVELAFLLPSWYAAALESAAHSRGLTTGQVVRDLIHRFLGEGHRE